MICSYDLSMHHDHFWKHALSALRATPHADGSFAEESIGYCFQLERSLAASWYASILSADAERYSQLAHSFALRLSGSLFPTIGTESCSQLLLSVAVIWYKALPSTGTGHCFQLERSPHADMERRSQMVRLLLLVGVERCSQLISCLLPSAGTALCFQLERNLAPG